MPYTTIYTVQDFLDWGPCMSWGKSRLGLELGEGWLGTLIDLLNHTTLHSRAKLLIAIVSGELSDFILAQFVIDCVRGTEFEDKSAPLEFPVWENPADVPWSEFQERARPCSGVVMINTNLDERPAEFLRQLEILKSLLE